MVEKIIHNFKEGIRTNMKEYKCIPAPTGLKIDAKGSYNAAVNSYADIINKETQGGWTLDFIQSVPVTQDPGCIRALFGAPSITLFFNMLVFSKEK